MIWDSVWWGNYSLAVPIPGCGVIVKVLRWHGRGMVRAIRHACRTIPTGSKGEIEEDVPNSDDVPWGWVVRDRNLHPESRYQCH